MWTKESISTLGRLIQLARKNAKTETGETLTQDDLAKAAGTSKQWISNIERDIRLPALELLLRLYEKLDPARDQNPVVWLLKWLSEKVQRSDLHDENKKKLQATIEAAVASIGWPTLVRKPGRVRSLEDFPHAFKPLTIICGDRREPSPQSRGDVFAYSVAITDLMFLLKLGLDRSVVIKSDKLFVVMDEEYLRHKFSETNLLIIGSPAVNLAARVMNNYSVFRFDLDRSLREWNKKLRSVRQLDDLQNLDAFWKIAKSESEEERERLLGDLSQAGNLSQAQVNELTDLVKQLIGKNSPKDLMNKFKKPGLADPADGKVHGTSTNLSNDFAVISLAQNPFGESPDYVCIMIGGIHGPGTAHALRALAEGDFKDHPFGGIIEVKLDQFKDWPSRFEQAQWRWQTGNYTPQKILANLENALNQRGAAEEEAFKNLTQQEITACMEFVRRLMGVADSSKQPGHKRNTSLPQP